jgi:hypothetical protein
MIFILHKVIKGGLVRVHLFVVYRLVYRDFGGYRAGPVAKPAGIPLAYHT